MNNMKEFYQLAHKFFNEGIIREVYFNDIFCICNVANCNYALFPFVDRPDFKKNGPVGLVISKSFVKLLVEDASNLKFLSSVDSKKMYDMSFRLNDKNYLALKNDKLKTDLNGPAAGIDFDMEKEIMGMSKSR